ncbi:1-deoxy-D-xylulose-5-phosphate reductoisomerase [Chloroflexota bacterium]
MSNTKKRLVVLGSTGSIGWQTLDVVRAWPEKFRVVGLAAGNNIDLLVRQAGEFQSDYICCAGQDEAAQSRLTVTGRKIMSMEDMVAQPDVDLVVMAVSGGAGLSPTLAAVKAGKEIALANKESLVAAGGIITAAAEDSGARILPVDSEHSAIWQCLNGEKQKASRIILTASGGPFRGYTPAQLKGATAAQALNHPSWQMGPKVTVDSATLMNKGLEIIEARWLFGVAFENIEVLIHPQSIIHSMVEFADGSVKAQLSLPDMRLPIQYALTYPDRLSNPEIAQIDWKKIKSLDFEPPDFNVFPCLKLGIEAGKKGGTYPAVLCAADEVAVDLFLAGRLGFTDIARFISLALEKHQSVDRPGIEEIIAADGWARQEILNLVDREN